MTDFFLGADLGGTKTHVMIANANGQVIGFGEGGPGNHETAGFDGIHESLHQASIGAFNSAGINPRDISGAGFGVAGYDWPNQKNPILRIIETLNLGGKIEMVNDTVLGILAGSSRMWGIAVVSGTGCNCWGWDETRSRLGRVTGGGVEFGENAGASELMFKTSSALARAWTTAGPPTMLTEIFCQRFGAKDLPDLLQGLLTREYEMTAADAPLVFEAARAGDAVAVDIVRWAGHELGEMACAVIHQLEFEELDFDLVQIGSMFDGSPLLTEEMRQVILNRAPKANLIRLKQHPVLGAVLLGMEAANFTISPEIRKNLSQTIPIRQPNR